MRFLKELQATIKVKSEQAKLLLQSCEILPPVMKTRNKQQLIGFYKLVEQVGDLNDLKIRTVTALLVKKIDLFADTVDPNNQTNQALLVEENDEE